MSNDSTPWYTRAAALLKAATPGPWSNSSGKGTGAVSSRAAGCAIYQNIRTVEIPETVARWQADAALIAAAPTLLAEALRERDDLLDLLSTSERNNTKRGDAYQEQLDAALARATAAEARYVELADALGYVNRADGRSGHEVADHATLLEAARTGAQAAIDVDDFNDRTEAAEARVADLQIEFNDRYDTGFDFGLEQGAKQGAAAERAAIVAWLRKQEHFWGDDNQAPEIADCIEALAHHPAPTTHATGDGDE
jgi:hypothetical protein